MRAARHSERGASLVETAIVMSVVLLLLFGIIDFGRAMYSYSFVATAAREGARWMIVRGSQSCTGEGAVIDNCNAGSSALQTYVRSLNNGVLNSSSLTATATFTAGGRCMAAGSNGPGCTANVTVTYPFPFVAPFVHSGTISMSSTSKMVISQ